MDKELEKSKLQQYITEVWAKSYPKRRKKDFGFMDYDKNLCNYIIHNTPKGSTLLEVAIGTGYPLADFLQKSGYVIHGIDISPNLIEKCRELNPNIMCKIGNAEALEYEDNYFDNTYCFHSTWYFADLNKAIDEMIRVTRPGGMVIFDIANRNNGVIEAGYQRNLAREKEKGIRRFITFAKGMANVILRRRTFNWHFLLHYTVSEFPTYPEDIYQHLSETGIANFQVMVTEKDNSLHAANKPGPFKDFGRLVFVVRK